MSEDADKRNNQNSLPIRTRIRKAVVQYLYACDINDEQLDLDDFIRDLFLDGEQTEFAKRLKQAVQANREEIDEFIEENAENWSLDRMSVVDRNVLRIGLAEIFSDFETPEPVVVNECVELARRMGSEDSHKFINGILDRYKPERNRLDD